MAPPLLALDGIRLSFGGTPLLDGASLSASAGDRIALVGRIGQFFLAGTCFTITALWKRSEHAAPVSAPAPAP